jgi:hypothetical protein
MMKNQMTFTLMAVFSALALALQAQDNSSTPGDGTGRGGPGGMRQPPTLPLVTALDTNQDGIIDANEIANASTALLTLDKNGDGILTTNEYLPAVPKDAPAGGRRPPTPPTPIILQALDANGDGVIDATEIANAGAVLKTLDKNGDGKLTRDEYLGQPPPRPNGQNGPDGQGQGPGGGDNNMPPEPPPGDN